ncbi:ATP-binding protein [Aurantivibrio plasticivorans]
MKTNVPAIAAPRQNLALLLIIRGLLIFALLIGLAVSYWLYAIELPYVLLIWLVSSFVLLNIVMALRLRQPWPVTALEFSVQIVVDILAVSVLFFFCGGASNPFISYYLVPVTISMVTLPWRFTWALALLSIVCYSVLLIYNIPIPGLAPSSHAHHGASYLNAHVVGMWFNFILSVVLISYFVVRMANALKAQQALINQQREDNLRDEQLLAVATLAAGTAHELGTPLTTMKVLVDEMVHDYSGDGNLAKDMSLLKQQVQVCTKTLKDLSIQAEANESRGDYRVNLHQFAEKVIERWQVLRPDVVASISLQDDNQQTAEFYSTLDQALINLLNNAADACHHQVNITITWNKQQMRFVIEDDGAGIPSNVREQLGQPFVSTKRRGLGLGLFLSNATISRAGGTIEIKDRESGGTTLIVLIPLVEAEK